MLERSVNINFSFAWNAACKMKFELLIKNTRFVNDRFFEKDKDMLFYSSNTRWRFGLATQSSYGL